MPGYSLRSTSLSKNASVVEWCQRTMAMELMEDGVPNMFRIVSGRQSKNLLQVFVDLKLLQLNTPEKKGTKYQDMSIHVWVIKVSVHSLQGMEGKIAPNGAGQGIRSPAGWDPRPVQLGRLHLQVGDCGSGQPKGQRLQCQVQVGSSYFCAGKILVDNFVRFWVHRLLFTQSNFKNAKAIKPSQIFQYTWLHMGLLTQDMLMMSSMVRNGEIWWKTLMPSNPALNKISCSTTCGLWTLLIAHLFQNLPMPASGLTRTSSSRRSQCSPHRDHRQPQSLPRGLGSPKRSTSWPTCMSWKQKFQEGLLVPPSFWYLRPTDLERLSLGCENRTAQLFYPQWVFLI